MKELVGDNVEGQQEWRDVDDAIRAVAVLEDRASVDDSQSTLLSAVAERTKQRILARSISLAVAQEERKRLTQKIELVTANLNEMLRIGALTADGNNTRVKGSQNSGFLPNRAGSGNLDRTLSGVSA